VGFDRAWPKIPYQRLHPVDLFNMIDWVRDDWGDDEIMVTPRLQRLKWHLEALPDPYRMEALQQYETVTRARTVNDTPWLAALTSMRRIVSAWGNTIGVAGAST
jgi:hypothetical protein